MLLPHPNPNRPPSLAVGCRCKHNPSTAMVQQEAKANPPPERGLCKGRTIHRSGVGFNKWG